jgi:O-antigen ligase
MYKTAFSLWLKKPFIGSGVKSFGPECSKMLLEKKDFSCNVHPHNIYLEILINQGLLGIITFISLIILIINNLTKEIITNHNNKFIYIIFIIILIAEVWPLRSYGSIFQTVNGSIFWFLLALVSSRKYLFK